MTEDPEAIARDVSAVGRIDAVPALLRVICQTTGLGFAAVARVSGDSWTACAVHDDLQFGLQPGSQLDLHTTLCKESRLALRPVVIDHASKDPIYASHPVPQLYGIESYISVPIVLPDGKYFGNLCALDPQPAKVSEPRIVTLFQLFAELIAVQLEADRRQALQLEAQLDERAAGELREQFIAVLGHDLRNPLSAIQSCALALQRMADKPQARDMAERIVKNARRMSALIDDTMDLTRARLGGGIGVDLQRVPDLGAALRDVVSELQDANPARAVKLQVDIGAAVVCDKGRLQQLLSNLLANALTHGDPQAPVAVNARLDGNALVLEVRNQGATIPAGALPLLFEPFRRGMQAGATAPGGGGSDGGGGAEGGLGLGLYICAQIAKAHGGRLDARSTAEDGTIFSARIPVAPAPSNAA